MNTAEYANIPQNRERIFIVAFDPKQVENYKQFKFPEEIKLTKTIHDILEQGKQDDKYYLQYGLCPDCKGSGEVIDTRGFGMEPCFNPDCLNGELIAK